MAYQGFQKVQSNIESQGKSPAAAAAIAASIGRKKYGKGAMARAARTRTKLGGKGK
jgi:hypothetical protein